MGRVKQMLIRADDIGWMPNNEDKYVCASCMEDQALQEVVERNLEKNVCSYCGKRSRKGIAAPLDIVTEHMAECISRVYTDPAEVLPFESSEGGYQGTVYDTQELLGEIGFIIESNKLFEDICSSFVRNDWAERDWLILSPDQRKFYGWEDFKRAVKHKRRYTFWSMDDENEEKGHPDYMPVGNVLAEIAEVIQSADLVKTMKKGTKIWRVQIHDKNEVLDKDTDFTTPPVEKAIQPNRMSPAGVPMFYGADDFETAYRETVDSNIGKDKIVTGGCFTTLVELRILDLANMPPIPSFFDAERTDLRNNLLFLSRFVEDLAEPIQRDGCEHIEYVPTQAFTEYIRWMTKTSDGQPIYGIRYRSSRNGKICYVLFCEQDECVDKPKYEVRQQVLCFD
jgi:hypothetical protein